MCIAFAASLTDDRWKRINKLKKFRWWNHRKNSSRYIDLAHVLQSNCSAAKKSGYYTLLPFDAVARNLRYTQSFGLTCISDGQIFFYFIPEVRVKLSVCTYSSVTCYTRQLYYNSHGRKKKRHTVSRARCVTSFSLLPLVQLLEAECYSVPFHLEFELKLFRSLSVDIADDGKKIIGLKEK